MGVLPLGGVVVVGGLEFAFGGRVFGLRGAEGFEPGVTARGFGRGCVQYKEFPLRGPALRVPLVRGRVQYRELPFCRPRLRVPFLLPFRMLRFGGIFGLVGALGLFGKLGLFG